MNLSERLTSVAKVGEEHPRRTKTATHLVNIRRYSVFEDGRKTQISKEEGLQEVFSVN